MWLKETSRQKLLPEELSDEIIKEYKRYLARQINERTNQPLSNNTQNHYLIGLRVLLSYFLEKGIASLYPDKVKLLKQEKSNHFYTKQSLEFKIIKKILKAPNVSSITGLRDRAILETLFSTGLKVGKLVALNKEDLKIEASTKRLELKVPNNNCSSYNVVYFSESAIKWLKKYLKRRNDNVKPLFIRYKGPKNAPLRLTTRSIENIVKRYVLMTNYSPLFTPEVLRNTYILTLLKRQANIKISKKIFAHNSLTVDNYKSSYTRNAVQNEKIKTSKDPITWHLVETSINKEIEWLKNNISVLPSNYEPKHTLISCKKCLLRKIAILIVSGKVKALELKAANNKSLWNYVTEKGKFKNPINHGKDWHRKMMVALSDYFELKNCKVIAEPTLSHGRADLGVYSNSKSLYIEIGITSLYKLWYNFWTMKNVSFLLVPSKEYAIEFKV